MKQKFEIKRSFRWTLLSIILICLVYDAHDRWKGDWWKATINSDGYGYYAYLPAVFIQHNFNYAKIIDAEIKLRPEVPYRYADYFPKADNGKPTNKCFVGVAVLLTPFFLLAYLLSYLAGFSLDGYSLLFQLSVSIAALFYLAVGLIFIRKLLRVYSISENIISLSLLLLVLGTNLLYYVTIEPSMSHIYSFGMMAMFLYFTKKSLIESGLKNVVPMVAALCILLIIRPTAVFSVLLIPFLAGDFKSLQSFFAGIFRFKTILSSLIIAGSIIGIQLLVWYFQTGRFLYWSYRGEHFYFNNPRFLNVLFNYRCGWFVYTPLMFFILLGGLLIDLRNNLFRFFSFVIFFTSLTYLLSSWFSWYFGGFGMRAYVDYYPAFVLFLPGVLSFCSGKWIKIPALLIFFFLTYVNIAQTRQYANGIIDKGYMDKERYWKVFLKTDSKYVGIFDAHPPQNLKFYDGYAFENDFESNTWGNNNSITEKIVHNDRHSAYVGDTVKYSPTFKINASRLPQTNGLFVYVNLWVYMNDTNNDAALVISAETPKDSINSYNSIPLKKYVHYTSRWQEVEYTLALPAFQHKDDVLKVYAYATKGSTYIDDINISFATPK